MGIVVRGEVREAPEELHVINFLQTPSCYRFKNARRRGPVTDVILHETVTRSVSDTLLVLQQRGLGVHFVVGPAGEVSQHGDLATDELWHGSRYNDTSVGIEVVNPYEPRFVPTAGPWAEHISAPWAAGGRYVLPTRAQLEATCLLVDWLTSAMSGLTIPQLWPGFRRTHTLSMHRVPEVGPSGVLPGILAHTYFGHADGAFLVLYCWLRLEPMLGPEEAYMEAVRRATGAPPSGVDLDDFFVRNPYLQV